MGSILLFTACTLAITFLLPAVMHLIVDGIRFRDLNERINQTCKGAAFAIDVLCNVAYASLLNGFFIKKGGYHYGEQGETVTSATGKNWTMGTLTLIGEGLAGALNWIDKDHCFKYIMGPWIFKNKPPKVVWWKTALFLLVFVVLFCIYAYIAWNIIIVSARFVIWIR